MKQHILSLFICFTAPFSSTIAQTFTDISAPLNHTVLTEFIVGDIDNDGDLDILTYPVESYNNTPSKVFDNENGVYSLVNTWPGSISGKMLWAETNNDNFLDLIFNRILYENLDGEIFKSTEVQISANTFWADFDNDGDQDFITSGDDVPWDNITKIYINNGNNHFDEIPMDFPESHWISWADTDNDGDLDFLLSNNDSSTLFINNGGYTFAPVINEFIGVGTRSSNKFGDYNSDGLPDILISGSRVKLYRNLGDNQFHSIEIPAFNQYKVGFNCDWGDFDNDGDLDIIYNGPQKLDQRIRWII